MNAGKQTTRPRPVMDDPSVNPNSLHEFHLAKRGPRGVPEVVKTKKTERNKAKDPVHPYAKTQHISFEYFDQRKSNAPFGYEHYVSLPPTYDEDVDRLWPLILSLHGSGQSQRNRSESFLSIRHGIPKIVLCYDKMKSNPDVGRHAITIPRIEKPKKNKQVRERDNSEEPVPVEVCTLLAENFVTVTPSLNMTYGYGWSAPILSALLDEVVDHYRIDLDRIHVTGFSMGGYGTWGLAMQTPNRFATLMPICGGGDCSQAVHIKHVPLWVHHGDLDDLIPVEASQQMVDSLHKAGAPEVHFTRYPDLSHDSWTEAYNNPEVYHWMLSTKRRTNGDSKAALENDKVAI